jgi:hypothetical protein
LYNNHGGGFMASVKEQRQIMLIHQTTEAARTVDGHISDGRIAKNTDLLPTGLELGSPKAAADMARTGVDR